MKIKSIVVLATFPCIFYSCEKDPPVPPAPVASELKLEKSARLGNQMIVPPGTDTIAEFIVRIHSASGDEITITNGTLRLTPSGGLDLSMIRNVTVVVSNSSGEVWRQNIASYAYTPIGFMTSIFKPVGTSVDTIRIIGEILDESARGTLTTTLELGYKKTSYYGTITSGVTSGQTMTYSSAVLSTSVGNPKEKLIIGTRSDTAMAISLYANGQNISNPTLYFSSNGYEMIERISIYDGTNVIGQTSSFSGNTASIPLSFNLPHGTVKNLMAIVTSKSVNSETQSRVNIGLNLSKVTYLISNGEVRTNDTLRPGNKLYTVKAYPKIEVIPISNTNIVNGVSRQFLHLKVSAIGGPVSLKQIEIQNLFGDQLPDSNLALKNIRIFDGTVERTGDFRIYNQAGEIDSVFTESDSKIYLTRVGGSNEDVITSSKDYWIWFTPDGFANGAGDAVRISVVKDVGDHIDYNQLTLASVGQIVGLRSPSGGIIIPRLIWSDMSAGPAHSANTELSSNDFSDGSLLEGYGSTQIFSR